MNLPRLTRRVDAASQRRFLEVTGRRIALLGNELGVFECWIWPLKVCSSLELSVRGDRLWRGRDLAREVAFQPDRTEVLLVGPDFRVRQTLFASLERRALVMLFDVESERDLELEVGLVPEFVPMWPAGLGGQIALRDESSGAFALTEELGRFAALFGSPEAEPLLVSADHALPRAPVAIKIPVSAARAKRGPVPCFVVGAETTPKPLSEAAKVGEEGAAAGHARSREVLELARAEYRAICTGWPTLADELVEHWTDFLGRTTHFESDDARHTEAFLWAKIAIEKAWVEVDGLGRGLVAGLAPSGAGTRPGFGWFFDGDAIVASRAMVGYGDRKGARRALDFAASHQRADGKMMHELVLSARLCNWFEDYPYAFYKAQLTPGFISCLDHYLSLTGDGEVRQQLWPNVLAAYSCCIANLEEDGLLSNQKLGIAAVEAGALVGKIRAEIYLQGIWMSALRGVEQMATALGDIEVAKDAKQRLEHAKTLIESFWSEKDGRYAFAHLVDGTLCTDSTAYNALPLSRGFGKSERALASAAALNRPNLASDWGVRLFANDASLYDATNYNTGSVFPYANNFAILAQFAHGLTTSGHQLLASQVALHNFSGLGFIPEHLQGERCEAPERGVPHQIFSSSCILQSTLFGMLGWHAFGEGVRGLLLSPSLPPRCMHARFSRLRVAEASLEVVLRRERTDGRTRLIAEVACLVGRARFHLWFPFLPPLSRSARVRFDQASSGPIELWPDGAALKVQPNRAWARAAGDRIRADFDRPAQTADAPLLGDPRRTELEYESGPELLLDDSPLVEGSTSSRLRVCETVFDEHSVTWTIWGLAGERYRLPFRSDRAVDFEGATLVAPGELALTFAAGPRGTFVSQQLRAVARD